MNKKTSTEILNKMDKDLIKRKELKKIRQQRKELEEGFIEGMKKDQKRKVEIIEYEDGTFSLIGYAYNLPLKRDEVEYAFKAWLDKSLEDGVKLN